MTKNRITLTVLFLLGFVLAFSVHANNNVKYSEKDGIVLMEAENTSSSLGLWEKKTDNPGFTGSGHLEFTGNTINGGDPKSPLTYTFKINKGGYYQIHIRARKRLAGAERDKCNDGYVKIDGSFDAGREAGNGHNAHAPKSMLSKNTKLFGGTANGWAWAETLDAGGHGNKRIPIYYFKAGQVYTLTLSGRSIRWNVDRIVFAHESVAKKTWQNSTKETLTEESDASFKGRIAVIADGNSPDPDDIGGTPATIAMFRIFGLNKKVVHYSHSCDLDKVAKYKDRERMMHNSLYNTARIWGGYDEADFFNYSKERSNAEKHLAKRINESSKDNLLYVVNAGETDLLWYAMNKANQAKRKYVRYLTHHPANDVGVYKDLTDILKLPGVPNKKTFVYGISDQNENLKKPISEMYWARDHSDVRVQELWKHILVAESEYKDFKSIQKKADISDAGLAWYICSGFKDQNCTYQKFEKKVNKWLSANTREDKIASVVIPTTVYPGKTVELSVNYSASENRDIRIVFQIDQKPWTTYNFATKTVTAGNGMETFQFEIPDSTPVANSEYQFQVYIAPVGKTWKDKLDNIATKNVTVSANVISETKSLFPIDDMYVENDAIFNNDILRVENDGRTRKTYLKFDLSVLQGSLEKANLVLKASSNERGHGTFNVYLGSHSDEYESNQSSIPEKGQLIGSYKGNIDKNQIVTFELDTLPVGQVVTLIIDMEEGGNDVAFVSSNTMQDSDKPKLELVIVHTKSTKVELSECKEIKMYPNPVFEQLTVEIIEELNNASIRILDFSGKLTHSQSVYDNLTEINTNKLDLGLYMLQVVNNNKVSNKVFIKK